MNVSVSSVGQGLIYTRSVSAPTAGSQKTEKPEKYQGVQGTQETQGNQGAQKAREVQGVQKSQDNTEPSEELSSSEQEELSKLKARDTEVRNHEQAHASAAGPYKQGSVSLEYQQGPDGQKYAVGGSVGIDTGKEATPEATVQKMVQVQRAALAPADPSSEDRAIAAKASSQLMEARKELSQQETDAGKGSYNATGDFTAKSDSKEGFVGSALSIVA